MVKDKNEEPDEELQMGEIQRVPNKGAFVSMELGCPTLPVHGHVHQPRSSMNCKF